MEQENNHQLELFSQGKSYTPVKSAGGIKSFFGHIRSYEKAIFMLIGFVIVGIASFSLGVEKGKRLAMLKDSRYDTALKIQALPTKPVARPVTPAMRVPEPQISAQPKSQPLQENYTIQLASYKTKSYAQREAETLKKRGLTPLVLPKGNYIMLCVGNFSSKEKAQLLLPELKKRYQDCRIRRL